MRHEATRHGHLPSAAYCSCAINSASTITRTADASALDVCSWPLCPPSWPKSCGRQPQHHARAPCLSGALLMVPPTLLG
eukprot:365028-Chlamydomonas_euryale.AAC.39